MDLSTHLTRYLGKGRKILFVSLRVMYCFDPLVRSKLTQLVAFGAAFTRLYSAVPSYLYPSSSPTLVLTKPSINTPSTTHG
jgi:hypothetical protein